MGKLIKGGVYSKPVKLNDYSTPNVKKEVKPGVGGLSAKLPKKGVNG